MGGIEYFNWLFGFREWAFSRRLGKVRVGQANTTNTYRDFSYRIDLSLGNMAG